MILRFLPLLGILAVLLISGCTNEGRFQLACTPPYIIKDGGCCSDHNNNNICDADEQISSYCGDGTCQSDENCYSCPQDCGICTKGYNTYISQGIVNWEFVDTHGNRIRWSMPVETYRGYVSIKKNVQVLSLDCSTCVNKDIYTTDYRAFIQPDFFVNTVGTLIEARTDREFVAEVINLKSQLIVYKVTNETAQWPVETLTEGQGSCRDSAVLMASLLEAGNRQAYYGMKIKLVYLDGDNPERPEYVNHVILYIEYKDGSSQFVETTASENVDIYERVKGWYLDINVEKCDEDGTIYGKCSGYNVGWYCDNGNLIPYCQMCGCPEDYPYCRYDGKCIRY